MVLGQAKKFSATTASVPAPIGGWNARDSLASMAPTDAVQLVNWFPTPTNVSLRKGYAKASTGITGKVYSLMNYPNNNGSYSLFGAAESKIWDASNPVAVEVFSGLTSSKFQHVNYSNSGGHYLVACNGQDATMIYDGTRWFSVATTTTAQTISTLTYSTTTATMTTASPHGLVTGNRITVTGATPSAYNGTFVITKTGATTLTYTMTSNPGANASPVGSYTTVGITGVDSSTFINVNLFKNRLWFTQKDTMKVWYLDANSLGGAATSIDFGGIVRNAGFLQAMGTWTIDAGQGVDDYAVFVTNMGEVIVYNGTDPSNIATWALKGVWQLGQTFNRRCFYKWAGDLLLLTQDGLVPLASALQSSRLDPRINLTDKIYYAVSQAATQYYSNFGWQINYYASENMLILSIPTNEGMEQYVMHTITKSWARFTGIEAYCWEVSGDADMHFGGDGFVGIFYQANSDAGTNIQAVAQQAYNYFEAPGQLKRFTMVRPILQTNNGVPALSAGISVDYDPEVQFGTLSFNPSIVAGGIWDASLWDDALWASGFITTKIWQGVSGLGFSGSINFAIASQGIDVQWTSTDFVMEKGGVL
jgi:hypothetical protein